MPNSHQIMQEFIKATETNIQKALKSFPQLSENQLNWKPNPDSWSVGECISHLVNSNSLYITKLEKILSSLPSRSPEDISYKQSFMGKLIAKAVNSANAKKSKTIKVFFPEKSVIQKTIVEDYINSSEKFIELVSKMHSIDLKKIKLSSPVNILIRLNLGDPLIIIPKHDERHLNRAEKLKSLKEFPTR